MLEIYPHLPSPFPFSSSFFLKKTVGNLKKTVIFFKFPTMFFLIASYKDIENSILQPNAFMMR
jgi:hypothetical protein